MPILNYTTEVSVSKSMGEVTGALAKRGVTRISTLFDPETGDPAGIAFTMRTDYGIAEFELPIRTKGVLAALIKDNVAPKYRTMDHAAKVAWRIAKVWLEAQSALIDAELATLDEVMLPYMITNAQGDSVYKFVTDQRFKALES